jgi:uncharacterized RDD family membrane protein YckC
LSIASDAPADLLRAAASAAPAHPLAALPLDTIVAAPPAPSASTAAAASRAAARSAAPALPLFQSGIADDEPLIKLPPSPRPPLAVRRTPDRPRRSTPKPVRRPIDISRAVIPSAADAQLHLVDDAPATIDDFQPVTPPVSTPEAVAVTSTGRRLSAALIDHVILFTVDLIVVYFTIKMAALPLAEWRSVPPLPLASFLMLVKLAYFATFTLVGGQTIGKMALRIRVVGEDGSPLDPGRAFQRTLVGAVSLLAVGAGLVPLLVGSDRRGFHDRVARTRVVAVPSARSVA